MTQATTLFHTTAHAAEILSNGFVDGCGHYGFVSTELRGVFLAAMPASEQDGATGDEVLAVTVPAEFDLDEFAIVEQGMTGWEWCVPASLLNASATVRLLTAAQVDELGW